MDSPLTFDASEFVRLIGRLDEKHLRRGTRGALRRAIRVITVSVMQEARADIGKSKRGQAAAANKGSWQQNARLGVKVWRRPLWADVGQFVWRKDFGATTGLIKQKGREGRPWLLRVLNFGTGDRYTLGGGTKARRYTGRIEAMGFFERGVSRSYQEAVNRLGVYTLDALRKLVREG